jgi:eukaryotic-like serine/threonine-protein kinase
MASRMTPPTDQSSEMGARPPRRGETLGRFVVLDLVGTGGMGEVYAAYDPVLNRKVAVKLLRLRDAHSTKDEARLLREAQAIAKLSHPNVIVVYEVGEAREAVFIAMEFVDGGTLGSWMKAGSRSWREVLRVFQASGRGLAAAHDAGLVHRDFKPENVMITKDGQVRVMDFGLASPFDDAGTDAIVPPSNETDSRGPAENAKILAADSTGYLKLRLTQTGAAVGTPAYMAPEQFVPSRPADARTDQFSFCVALYEGLYGERPFDGETFLALGVNVMEGRLRPPPENARVPGWLRRILLRGLATSPDERFPSMAALLAALEQDPGLRRRRWATLVLGLGLLGGVAFAANRMGAHPRNMCLGAASHFAGVWDLGGQGSERQQAIKRAFMGTGKTFAAQTYASVVRLLDDYLTRWGAMYRDACEATNVRAEQSAEVLSLRMACLDTRIGNVRALTDVFMQADDGIVANAVNAANGLPPIEPCANVAALRAIVELPDDAAIRKRVADLRADLARFVVQRDAGRCPTAEAMGTRLLAQVRATGYRPLLAETLQELSLGANYCGDANLGIARAKEAYREAIAARDDRVAAFAALEIPYLAADRLSDAALAKEWIGIAHATVDRLGGDERLEAEILDAETFLTRLQGPPETYLTMTRRDLEMTRRVLGANHPYTVGGLDNVGEALQDLGRSEEALTQFRLAKHEMERVLGRDHPQEASVLADECSVLDDLGRYEEARQTCDQALSIFESHGANDESRSSPLTWMGIAMLGLGRPEKAVQLLEQALAAETEGQLAPRLTGETRFALARALWSQAKSHARAVGLARLARVDRAKEPKAIAQIDTWLASHR